jgi:hypothetical protein
LVARHVSFTIYPYLCLLQVSIFQFEIGLWWFYIFVLSCRLVLKWPFKYIAKLEPDLALYLGLDPILIWFKLQIKILSRASMWQYNLVVTSTRSVDQYVLLPSEVRGSTNGL